jgi:hypothetical protein
MLLYNVAHRRARQGYLSLKFHQLNLQQLFKVELPLWFRHCNRLPVKMLPAFTSQDTIEEKLLHLLYQNLLGQGHFCMTYPSYQSLMISSPRKV